MACIESIKLEEHLNLQLREHAEAALIAMVLRLGLSFGVQQELVLPNSALSYIYFSSWV